MMTKCAERYRPNDLTALITRLSTQKKQKLNDKTYHNQFVSGRRGSGTFS